jgi:putative acetyltransferase
MDIRAENTDDRAAVRDVVARAFASQPEVPDFVDAIRASDNYVPDLALVAEVGRAVAGFVMCSYATLVDGDTRHRVLTLSPLAVAPEHQRRGIGAALVEAEAYRAAERGEPLIVLEGSPRYYGRLGFDHSVTYGIQIDLPDWAAAEAAQVRRLPAYDPAIRGRLEYPPAFAALSAH